jgi:hypothetical protein
VTNQRRAGVFGRLRGLRPEHTPDGWEFGGPRGLTAVVPAHQRWSRRWFGHGHRGRCPARAAAWRESTDVGGGGHHLRSRGRYREAFGRNGGSLVLRRRAIAAVEGCGALACGPGRLRSGVDVVGLRAAGYPVSGGAWQHEGDLSRRVSVRGMSHRQDVGPHRQLFRWHVRRRPVRRAGHECSR